MKILKTIAAYLDIENLTATAVQDNPTQVLEAITQNEAETNEALKALHLELDAHKLSNNALTEKLEAANSENALLKEGLQAKDLELSAAQKSILELSEAVKNAISEKDNLATQLQAANSEATELKGKINAIQTPNLGQGVKEERPLIIPQRRANKK